MTKTIKFTDSDRTLVIKKLEEIQKTKLTLLKPSRKLYMDLNGMYYLISGGTEDWHGINENIMLKLIDYNKEGAFVIAKKYKSKMEICVGPLLLFIENRNKLIFPSKGGVQFHNVLTEDGLYLEEISDLYCNKVAEILYPEYKTDFSKLRQIATIINIDIDEDKTPTHSDIQAKLILIGSYLGFRTYTPDKSKISVYGVLGDLCSEKKIPEGSIPALSIDTIKFIDVIWFDDEGFPTHCFEVEHSTDITKGLLRLYQTHKLRIKMFIIAEESSRTKFQKEVSKSPFIKIKEEFIFKNYHDLDEFFTSVKHFTKIQSKFGILK